MSYIKKRSRAVRAINFHQHIVSSLIHKGSHDLSPTSFPELAQTKFPSLDPFLFAVMLSNTLLYCVGAAVYAAQAVRASPVNRAVPSVGCSSPWVVLGIDIINDLEGSQGVHWCSSVLGKYQMVTRK
jgi:hypothetical protein